MEATRSCLIAKSLFIYSESSSSGLNINNLLPHIWQQCQRVKLSDFVAVCNQWMPEYHLCFVRKQEDALQAIKLYLFPDCSLQLYHCRRHGHQEWLMLLGIRYYWLPLKPLIIFRLQVSCSVCTSYLHNCLRVLIKNLLLLGLFTWLGGRILDLDQTSDMILQAGVLPEKKELYQGIWVYFSSSSGHIDTAFIKLFIGKQYKYFLLSIIWPDCIFRAGFLALGDFSLCLISLCWRLVDTKSETED